jgi:hypothetical protein
MCAVPPQSCVLTLEDCGYEWHFAFASKAYVASRPQHAYLWNACSRRLLDEWVGFLSDQLHGTAPSLAAAATPAAHVIPELQPSVRAARSLLRW